MRIERDGKTVNVILRWRKKFRATFRWYDYLAAFICGIVFVVFIGILLYTLLDMLIAFPLLLVLIVVVTAGLRISYIFINNATFEEAEDETEE